MDAYYSPLEGAAPNGGRGGCYYKNNNLFIIIILFSISNLALAHNKHSNLSYKTAPITNAIIKVMPEYNAVNKTAKNANNANNVNLTIKFNSQNDLTDWQFGFFMLYVFANPKNVGQMTICNTKTKIKNCAPLLIDQKPQEYTLANFMLPDTHTIGHVTFLKPDGSFPIQAGTTYTISLHGIKNNPQNITAMPQKLFIYNISAKEFIKIEVSSYSSNLVKQFKSNYSERQPYKNSIPLKIFYTPIVPLPQLVQIDKQHSIANIPLSTLPKLHICQEYTHDSVQKYDLEDATCALIKNQPEGYVLDISHSSDVNIYANTKAGVFYAKESLLQLQTYYLQTYHKPQIPVQRIVDYPRYKYRGIMLDIVRHFFTIDEVKKLLDVMASHKLNTLHLHLADDEGWRVAIAKYPELTTIGSIRGFNKVIGPANLYLNTNIDDVYQGYYTQVQIEDLINYANSHQITIIPEIEMPGHARAMKRSLPRLLFEPTDTSNYYTIQGYTDNMLPICKYNIEAKFTQTINDIITQTTNLFANQTTVYAIPNEISLSGDEVPDSALSDLKYCKQGQWRGKNITQISHLFFKNIAENLPNYKISGYQQLIEVTQNQDVVGASNLVIPVHNVGHIWQWEPISLPKTLKSGNQYAPNSFEKNRYPLVLAFANLSYFDMRYATTWDEPGLYWAANSANTFDALRIGSIKIKHAVGVEGMLWSELIPTFTQLFYMALPKMAGLAEAGWSKQSALNEQSLAARLGYGKTGFLAYLYTHHGVKYRGYPNGVALEFYGGESY